MTITELRKVLVRIVCLSLLNGPPTEKVRDMRDEAKDALKKLDKTPTKDSAALGPVNPEDVQRLGSAALPPHWCIDCVRQHT